MLRTGTTCGKGHFTQSGCSAESLRETVLTPGVMEWKGGRVRLTNCKTAFIMNTQAGETAGKLLFLKGNYLCQNKTRFPGKVGE